LNYNPRGVQPKKKILDYFIIISLDFIRTIEFRRVVTETRMIYYIIYYTILYIIINPFINAVNSSGLIHELNQKWASGRVTLFKRPKKCKSSGFSIFHVLVFIFQKRI